MQDSAFIKLIQKRRSIRRFQKRKVEDEKIELLIEAALRAPSSRGFNPWEFIVIKDETLLKSLSSSKLHGSAFLKNAPLAILVCADPEKSDVWVEDCSIASIFIQLAAESLKLGSCWIQIRKRMHDDKKSSEEFVREPLNIPERIKIESIIAVGYPDEKKPPHKKEDLKYEKIFTDLYGKKGGKRGQATFSSR